MSDYIKNLSEEEKQLIREIPFPEWLNPMLATLTNKQFSDPLWIYEPKFDGERALTFYQKKEIKILSRNQKYLNDTYPDILNAFQGQEVNSFIVDGEIVAFERGITSFSCLQQRLGIKKISLREALKVPVYYYLFDILYIDGWDVRALSLKTRKALLKRAIIYKDSLKFTEGTINEGLKLYKEACQRGEEGIMAKRLSSSYQNKRSLDWLKFKCHKNQEFIIIGYTAPKGHRKAFGALLIAYYNKNKLQYAGKVGTGFTEELLISLKEKMNEYIIPHSPINERVHDPRPITWLKPALVGEFAFTEWTKDGKLRHPRFKGLRYDKQASEVVREESV